MRAVASAVRPASTTHHHALLTRGTCPSISGPRLATSGGSTERPRGPSQSCRATSTLCLRMNKLLRRIAGQNLSRGAYQDTADRATKESLGIENSGYCVLHRFPWWVLRWLPPRSDVRPQTSSSSSAAGRCASPRRGQPLPVQRVFGVELSPISATWPSRRARKPFRCHV